MKDKHYKENSKYGNKKKNETAKVQRNQVHIMSIIA